MQIGIDVTCIHANFGGCHLYGFGDIATFNNGQFSLSNLLKRRVAVAIFCVAQIFWRLNSFLKIILQFFLPAIFAKNCTIIV